MSSRSRNFRRRREEHDADDDDTKNPQFSSKPTSTSTTTAAAKPRKTPQHQTPKKLLSFADDEDTDSPITRPSSKPQPKFSKPSPSSSSHKFTAAKDRIPLPKSSLSSNVQPQAAERKKKESQPAGTTGVRAEFEADSKEFGGIDLLDVLNLVYLGNDEIEPEKQLGKITMAFQSGTKSLYFQFIEDMTKPKPTIKNGDTIFVNDTGPICSFEDLEIEFNLFCGAFKGYVNVRFDPAPNEVYFEEHRIRSVDGTGQIFIVFGCYANATVADLEMKLVNISAATNVHGVVAARNSRLDQPSCTSVLFWKSPDNKMKVGLDGVIPLHKSSVGVPLDSEFYVDISLNVDGDVYTGTASFNPQTFNPRTEAVSAEVTHPEKETKISIKVKWDSRKNSLFYTYGSIYSPFDDDEYDTPSEEEGY